MLRKPYHRGKWLIWDNALFKPKQLETCDSTMEGVCYETNTVEECIKKTEEKGSDAGYFITTSKDAGICVPLNTETWFQNPMYSIASKDIYKSEIKDQKSWAFVNHNKISIPNKAGLVLLGDSVQLFTTDGDVLKVPDTTGGSLEFTSIKDAGSELLLVPKDFSYSWVKNTSPLTTHTKFTFVVPGLNIIPSATGCTNKLTWESYPELPDGMYFNMYNTNDVNGENISYDSKIAIRFGDENCPIVIKNKKLRVGNNSKDNTVNLMIKPLNNGYYCNENKCHKVPLYKTSIKNGVSHYKNNLVYRGGCFGLCHTTTSKLKNTIIIIIIIGGIGIICLIIFLILKYS